jgi:hypothetical protein
MEQPAEEVVPELGDPQAARVALVLEQVGVGVGVPQAHVGMKPVAGQVPERLGHERGLQPALLRERLDHVTEEDDAVRRW